jgi:hypothetical protein
MDTELDDDVEGTAAPGVGRGPTGPVSGTFVVVFDSVVTLPLLDGGR